MEKLNEEDGPELVQLLNELVETAEKSLFATELHLQLLPGRGCQTVTIGPFGVEDHGDAREVYQHSKFTIASDLLNKQPPPTLRITVVTRND